jgi:hypothetical protein
VLATLRMSCDHLSFHVAACVGTASSAVQRSAASPITAAEGWNRRRREKGVRGRTRERNYGVLSNTRRGRRIFAGSNLPSRTHE